MTRQSYFHRALFAPFIILLAIGILLALVSRDAFFGFMALLAFHVVIGVPWLVVALFLRWRTRFWPGGRLAASATLVPMIVAPLAGLATAVGWIEPAITETEQANLIADWLGWFMIGAIVTLIEGWVYAWLVFLGDSVRRRARIARARMLVLRPPATVPQVHGGTE
jgi:hypothetical protein